MRKYVGLLFILFGTTCLHSQSNDVSWVLGLAPIERLFFTEDTIYHYRLSDTLQTWNSNSSISNFDGEFQFYTNGIHVADKNGNIMPHGDSLSFYNPQLYSVVYQGGMPNDQGTLIIPKPNSERIYYVFHYSPLDTTYDWLGQNNNDPIFFYYSIVDMSERGGLGDVVKKSIRLPVDSLMCSSRMTAVKHGNGRDWWVIRHGQRDNKYIKFLVTPDSILGPYNQDIGPDFNQNGQSADYYGASAFNQFGDKMATGNFLGPVVVLDFDRCSGDFSNPIVINNKLADTTLFGIVGLAFSPNGRFLYANNIYELNQYDLWSSTVNDSIRIYSVDSTDLAYLHHMQLGPDGKLYIDQWHGGFQALHVINQPDSLGLNCDLGFKQLACITPNSHYLPNMVNYRLGKLEGSQCDTITAITKLPYKEGLTIKLQPNPATEFIRITYANMKWSKEKAYLEIINEVGQSIYGQSLPFYSAFQDINVSRFPRGFYIVTLKSSNGLIGTAKFAKN